MNPYKQRIAIAEACGWKRWDNPQDNHGHPYSAPIGTSPFLGRHALPSYLDDLNAMHAAEGTLAEAQHYEYIPILGAVVAADLEGGDLSDLYAVAHATAAQRAEAFLRTIGKWEDDK